MSLTGITATMCLFWFNHTTPDTTRWAEHPDSPHPDRCCSGCLFQTWPLLVVLLRVSVLTLPSVTKDRSWAFVDFQFKFSLGSCYPPTITLSASSHGGASTQSLTHSDEWYRLLWIVDIRWYQLSAKKSFIHITRQKGCNSIRFYFKNLFFSVFLFLCETFAVFSLMNRRKSNRW